MTKRVTTEIAARWTRKSNTGGADYGVSSRTFL
jgi:hypothetical protein